MCADKGPKMRTNEQPSFTDLTIEFETFRDDFLKALKVAKKFTKDNMSLKTALIDVLLKLSGKSKEIG